MVPPSIGLIGTDDGYVVLEHGRLNDEVFDRATASIDPYDQFGAFQREATKAFWEPAIIAGQDAHPSKIKIKHRQIGASFHGPLRILLSKPVQVLVGRRA